MSVNWSRRFQGKSKGLVLNDTNSSKRLRWLSARIAAILIGAQVILFVDPDVKYGGKRTGGIRVKLPKAAAKEKAAAKSATAEFLDDDLPDW